MCEGVCVGSKGSVVSFVCLCACFCVVCVCSSAAAWPLCPTGGSQWGRGGDVRAHGGSEGECLTSDLRYLPELGWWMESLSLN